MKPIIKYSKRRTIALSVNSKGEIIVRCPRRTCIRDIDSFLIKNNDWILKQRDRLNENNRKLYKTDFDPQNIETYKITAFSNFEKLSNKWANKINVSYKKVRLSNAKTRWGSCSSKGVISINWRLVLASEEIQSYVVLHEVMHLKHMNHSRNFWNDIEKYYKDYKCSMGELKELDYLLQI